MEYGTLYLGFVTLSNGLRRVRLLLGFDPMFGYVDAEYRFEDAWLLLWFVVLGIVAATVGYLYARIFYATEALTARLSVPGGAVLMPTVGGLLVGLLGLALPQILSSGYGWVQLATTKTGLLAIPVVDRAGPADRENRRDVVVHRHRRLWAESSGPGSSSGRSWARRSGGWATCSIFRACPAARASSWWSG